MNKLGFGFLRLPMNANKSIDYSALDELVDAFLAGGGRYFDTAYTYLGGLSEEAIRKSLVERHPRDSFILADKLPGYRLKEEADSEKYFAEQCARCGVDYFDVYLLHWLNDRNNEIAERLGQFDFLARLKATGKVGRIGFSYHGSAVLLDRILTTHPEVDIVQLQINYLDWDDPAIEAGKCYAVAAGHGKEIVVMEPVKGGTLACLPAEAEAILRAYAPEKSPAAWALQFAESLASVEIVLSGMNTMAQLTDNLTDRTPITNREKHLLREVSALLNQSIAIPCTACEYCVTHCPRRIAIPDYFKIYNSYIRRPGEGWKIKPVYAGFAAQGRGRASDCIACRLCEQNCPQEIKISEWMTKIAAALE